MPIDTNNYALWRKEAGKTLVTLFTCSVSNHVVWTGPQHASDRRHRNGAMVKWWPALASRRICQWSNNSASAMAVYTTNVVTNAVQFYFTVLETWRGKRNTVYHKHWLVSSCLLFPLLWIIQHSTKVTCVTTLACFNSTLILPTRICLQAKVLCVLAITAWWTVLLALVHIFFSSLGGEETHLCRTGNANGPLHIWMNVEHWQNDN
jgi:hypothetical protein